MNVRVLITLLYTYGIIVVYIFLFMYYVNNVYKKPIEQQPVTSEIIQETPDKPLYVLQPEKSIWYHISYHGYSILVLLITSIDLITGSVNG